MRIATTSVFVFAIVVGCGGGRTASVLTMRGSTPCPPGSGAVETWCDDAANCEFRVTGGPTFACSGLSSTDCQTAALDAANACSGGGGRDGGPGGPDGGSGIDASIGGTTTRTYVIGSLDTEAEDPSEAYGFDLDMMDGGTPGTCTDALDWTSAVTGASGVDDQFAGLAPTLDGVVGADGFDGLLNHEIAGGDLLVVLQVGGIDSYTSDPSVTVGLFLAQVQSGGAPSPSSACAAHGDDTSCTGDALAACSWGVTSSRCTGIAAGQTFATRQAIGTPVSGTITGGRLSATFSALTLAFHSGTRSASLPLQTVRVGGHITATAITGGELGGRVSVAAMTAMFTAVVGTALDPTSFVSPDLDPSGSDCNSYSVGMAFAALDATLL